MMNVFDLRYRILREYYDSFFIDEEPLRFQTVLDLFRKENLVPRYILMNTVYLLAYQYLTQEGTEYRISARGIKFIEDLTKGDMQYALYLDDSLPRYKVDQSEYVGRLFDKFNKELQDEPNVSPSFSLEQANNSTKPNQSNQTNHP